MTDLASVPRICWMLIAPWDIARETIHDLLYKRIRQRAKEGDLTENINAEEVIDKLCQNKKRTDKVFLAAMKDVDLHQFQRKIYSKVLAQWSCLVAGQSYLERKIKCVTVFMCLQKSMGQN